MQQYMIPCLFCLKLVSNVVTIEDTGFKQKCMKLRCHGFCALADWSLKQEMSKKKHLAQLVKQVIVDYVFMTKILLITS